MTDELDTSGAVLSYLNEKRANEARIGLASAIGSNPDYEAELQKVAKRTGVPVDSARANFDDVKRQDQMSGVDFDSIAKQFPKTAALLAETDKARVSHDDIDNLTEHERLLKQALASGRAIRGRVGEIARSEAGGARGVDRSFTQGITEPVRRGFAGGNVGLRFLFNEMGLFDGMQRQRDAARVAAGLAPESQAFGVGQMIKEGERATGRFPIPEDIQSGMQAIGSAETLSGAIGLAIDNPRAVLEISLQSLGTSAPALAGAVAGSAMGPLGTSAGAGMGSFAVEYGNTIREVLAESGVNMSDAGAIASALGNAEIMAQARDKALKRGVAVGAFDALTAGLAGRLLSGARATAASVAGRAAGELGLQAGGGAAGEAVAQLATDEYKPGDIVLEALAELPSALVEVPSNYRSTLENAKAADQRAQVFEQINTIAEASKVRARDSETFEQFIEQAADGADVQNVYIDAATLMQSGIGEQLAKVSPSVASQLQQAAASGGEVRIPVAEYVARVAGSELSQSLIDDIRIEGEQFTRKEAREYMQNEAAELESEFNRAVVELEANESWQQMRDQVQSDFKAQLDAVKRFTPEVNQNYAGMLANFYSVTASKLSVSPQELVRRYGLRIVAENPAEAGRVLNQGNNGGVPESTKPGPNGEQRTGADQGNAATSNKFSEDNRLSRLSTTGPSWQRIRESNPELSALGPDDEVTVYRATIGDTIRPDDFVAVSKKTLATELKNVKARDKSAKIVSQKVKVRDLLMGNDATEFVYFPEQRSIAPHKAAAQQIADKIQREKENDPFATFALRIIPGDYDGAIAPGDVLPESFRWDDGTQTDETLGGTSAIEIKGDDASAVEKALRLTGAHGGPGPNGFYWGDRVVLVKGDSIGPGEDVGEALLSPAEVVATWKKPSKGNSEVQPNEQTAPDSRGATLAQQARGTFNPDTNTIALLNGADLTTFIHESGHFFLEVQMDLASRIQTQIDAGASVTDGERGIVEDARKILNWFGVKGGEGVDALTEWGAMNLEEKRPMHEQWARGFEAYAFSGDVPSADLQGVFRKFRAWLIDTYKSLKALNVELTDEVRGVMDRMMATSEQIKFAEQARSMMPFFGSAEEAKMSPDEFAAYQELGAQATDAAIEEVQARSMRDMKWIHNARGREVAKLQKQVAELRREVRQTARRDVMRQPVYAAWQFLTGKAKEKTQEQTAATEAISKWRDSRSEAELSIRNGIKAKLFADNPDAKGLAKGQLFAKNKRQIDIDVAQELLAWDKANPKPESAPTPKEGFDLGEQVFGRLDADALKTLVTQGDVVAKLKSLRMVASEGMHPDIVAEMFGFQSGDELARTIAASPPPDEAIEALTDRLMLEQYGDMATPEAIERAADQAIHNEARAKALATEANALAKASGGRKILANAAREFARNTVSRLKIKDIRPGEYAAAEVKAARAAEKARGDIKKAAAEKRNQLLQNYLAKSAYEAQDEVSKGLRYLERFKEPGSLPADHYERILMILEKFDLRKSVTNKSLDNRARFSTWVRSQLDAGDIPPNFELLLSPLARKSLTNELQSRNPDGDLIYADEDKQAELIGQYLDESPIRSYKDVTVEEFRGLIDAVKQIDHIGRRTKKVLTDRAKREFADVVEGIRSNAANVASRTDRESKDVRSSNTTMGKVVELTRGHFFSHVKASALIEVIDGAQGGPLWESLMRTANEATDSEVLEIAAVHNKVVSLLRDLKSVGDITDRPKNFPTIGRALNRQARIAMAMNMGNDSNIQRLLGGEGWSMAQIKPVLDTLAAKDWQFVQAMWDLYETQRPAWSAVYREINGADPVLVDPLPLVVTTADGQTLNLRGGYAPVIFDPKGSGKAQTFADEKGAKESLRAARVASTVNKSFTKPRVDELSGRPLLLSLDALINGMQDTIHYTHWQPWIIDANRIVKALDPTLREFYGAEAVKVLRDWVSDTAAGVQAPRDTAERWIAWTAKNVSFATLAMNVMNAAQQITGINSSIVTLGAGGSAGSGFVWMGRGLSHVMRNRTQAYRQAIEKSAFMRKRATTMLRDLNETANVVQDQGAIADFSDKYGYILTQMMQITVDLPTWWGAYHKAGAEQGGFAVLKDGSIDDSKAVALADQAVVDSQGGGARKDLARYERSTGAMRLLSGFMSYMNAMFNQNYRIARSERSAMRKGLDLLLINTIPVVMMVLMKALLTPGGDDDEAPEDLAKKIALEQIGFMFGQMIGLREISQIAAAVAGEPFAGSYGGPVGLRMASDVLKLGQQVGQGEGDLALTKAALSVAGDVFRIPSTQINRTITGISALEEGETENPAAILFGYQR